MQNHNNAMWGRRHERRGWVGTAIAAIPAVTSTFSSITANKEDASRFQRAQEYYTLAKAGDTDAECALKYLSGRYGCQNCGRFGQACGFATQVAKDYAGQLYDQLVQVKAGTLSPQAPIPNSPSTGSTPISIQTQTTPGGGTGVTIQTGTNPPMTDAERRARLLNVLLIGGAIVAAIVAFGMFRRRR